MIIPSRRRFLFGAATLLAAPSIVRVASLMSVSSAWRSPRLMTAAVASTRSPLTRHNFMN